MSDQNALRHTESVTSKGTFDGVEKPQMHSDKMGGIIEVDEDGDEAGKLMSGQRVDFTEEEERRVLRRIDWRLMPLMAVTCGLQFVDKSALGNAAVFGLRTDLRLKGHEFSTAVSIFYVGYIVGIYPAVRLMQKYNAGKVIGISAILWGICIFAMMAVKNWAGLMVLRTLLGLFESPLNAGFSLITTRWYRQREMPWRFALWTLLNGWLPVPFLVMYYGIGTSNGGPLAPWRWIFLLLGVITIAIGICCFFFLPDQPTDAKWLSEREKIIAVERVARSQTGLKNQTFKWSQAKEALTDPVCWLLTLQMFFSQSGGAVNTNFLGIVISGFGYDRLTTILLQCPTFAIQGVVCLLVAGVVTFIPRMRDYKQPILSIAAAIVIAGATIIYTHEANASTRPLLLGSMYMIAVSNCSFTTILAIVGVNTAGTTKKTTLNAMLYVAQCISNVVIPQAFLTREAPSYHTGILTVLAFQAAVFVCYWASWTLMRLSNRKRDRAFAALTSEQQEQERSVANEISQGLRDLTDRQNVLFRYQG